MSIPAEIKDGRNTNYRAGVTKRNQLITSPLEYSTPVSKELSTINTAFNFFKPKAGRQLVVTDIIVGADRDVSPTTGALIEIYTAISTTSISILTDILTLPLTKNASISLTGLNFLVDSGVWVNAKTDDATVFITIAGYYIEE